MLRDRFLSRPRWEKKLRDIGAEPLEGMTPLNTAEWWRIADGAPFMVPVEDDGSSDFWAIQRIVAAQTGRRLLEPPGT